MGSQRSDNPPYHAAIDDRGICNVSPGSDSCTFTEYGLKRALERSMLRPPTPTTKQEQKDAEYIENICQRRKDLKRSVRHAELIFNQIDDARNANGEDDGLSLHYAWLAANNKLVRAERDYNTFIEDVKALMGMPPMTRDDLYTEVTLKRARGVRDLKEADKIEDDLLRHEAGVEMAELKKEGRELKKEVKDLKDQLIEADKQFAWAQDECGRIRRNGTMAMSKSLDDGAKLNQELERLCVEKQQVETMNYELQDKIEWLEQQVEDHRFHEKRIESLEQQLEDRRYWEKPPSAIQATIVQDLKGAHEEYFGLSSESYSYGSSVFHVSNAAVLGDIGNAQRLRQTQSACNMAQVDGAMPQRADSNRQSGESVRCNWHPEGACEILSPEDQARGKICAVIGQLK